MTPAPGDHFAGMGEAVDEATPGYAATAARMVDEPAPVTDAIVHVRVVDLGLCRPAVVLTLPYWPDSEVRARVLTASRFGPVGNDDREGNFAPTSRPTRVVTPDLTERTLDHWHRADDCPFA